MISRLYQEAQTSQLQVRSLFPSIWIHFGTQAEEYLLIRCTNHASVRALFTSPDSNITDWDAVPPGWYATVGGLWVWHSRRRYVPGHPTHARGALHDKHPKRILSLPESDKRRLLLTRISGSYIRWYCLHSVILTCHFYWEGCPWSCSSVSLPFLFATKRLAIHICNISLQLRHLYLYLDHLCALDTTGSANFHSRVTYNLLR